MTARRICRTLVSRQLRFWLVHRPPGLPVRRPHVLLVQPPRARPRPSPQLRVLPVRKPPSSRSWRLLALPPWPLRARPCGRLHAPPSSPPRVARVRQPRSSLSQRLRALPASPPRARLFAQRRAPPSRQLYASLARWLRASPSLLPRASPAAQLRAGLSPRRQALPARLRLCDPVVCVLDRSRTVGDIDLCLLCSGLEFPHLLPCRICVRTTLLRGAF